MSRQLVASRGLVGAVRPFISKLRVTTGDLTSGLLRRRASLV